MPEPTKEMLALARECAAKYWQTGEPSDEAAARSILSGEWDDQAYVQAALAAIQATTEKAANYIANFRPVRKANDRSDPWDRGFVTGCAETTTEAEGGLLTAAHLKETNHG